MNIKDKLKYLDPYHYMDLFIEYLHKRGINSKILDFFIYIVYSIIIAYLILQIISLILQTDEGLMIVVSGSMEPYLNIGDVVIIKGSDSFKVQSIKLDINIAGKRLDEIGTIEHQFGFNTINGEEYLQYTTKSVDFNGSTIKLNTEGDTVVYYSETLKRTIIHRSVLRIEAEDGNYYLTKGDNLITNTLIDQDCTIQKSRCISNYPIKEEDLKGKYIFKIPYIGLIKTIPAKLLGFN